MRATILLLTYNGWELTRDCIKSVLGNNMDGCELLLVDNGSTDGTAEKAKNEFGGKVRVARLGKNYNFAQANNIGARHARGDVLVLLTNDTICAPDWLEKLVAPIERGEADAVAPRIFFHENGDKSDPLWFGGSAITPFLPKVVWHMNYRKRGVEFPPLLKVPFVSGCCLAMKKSVFEKLGGYPEQYGFYFEDAELSVRAGRAGMRMAMASESLLWHRVSMTLKKHSYNWYYLRERNRTAFVRRNFPIWLPLHFAYCTGIISWVVLKEGVLGKNKEFFSLYKALFDSSSV